MLRPEFATRPTAPTEQALRPVQPLQVGVPAMGASGAAFGATFNALRAEVLDFIEQGSGHGVAAPASPALSAEGQIARGVVQAQARSAAAGSAEFLAAIAPAAQEAASRLGVAPELIAAHAALESGWGRHPLRQPDGRDTHNLFGIKAGSAWPGEVANATTTEVEDGVAVRKEAPFRSYPDAASAFRDYTRVLLDNPRYRDALDAGADARKFAEGLARGGYATNRAYADKLVRVARSIRWTE
jgi:flagellar protein FlgJ